MSIKKIGIVIAIERELEAFLKSNYEIEELDNKTFKCFRATINGNDVYAIKSGWGLIDASMATQYLITKYGVEIVLNFGVTGALDPTLKVSDLFYVSKCVNFDFDTSTIDNVVKHQYGDMEDVFIPLDAGLIDMVKSIYPEIKEAVDASGDLFIDKKADKEARFNAGCNICDMEIAAIARVCLLNNVKCLSIKCISDEYDGDGSDFEKNVRESADKAFKLIDKILNHAL
ncbi:MAG: 5'-methylthioadenosine/S-adenosylhomocysteine nucleosidase [Firmicutes bacterium]|nr:5'-methylthioadenosine/S-adenosylhomocysteine nucleosidase [Bacillota bacterium]